MWGGGRFGPIPCRLLCVHARADNPSSFSIPHHFCCLSSSFHDCWQVFFSTLPWPLKIIMLPGEIKWPDPSHPPSTFSRIGTLSILDSWSSMRVIWTMLQNPVTFSGDWSTFNSLTYDNTKSDILKSAPKFATVCSHRKILGVRLRG